MKELKEPIEIKSWCKTPRSLARLPIYLLPLSLGCILTACGHRQEQQPPAEGMAIRKGLELVGERAAAAGKKSITVDLNELSGRKVRRVCVQFYSEYSSLSRLSQSEQFEQEIKEDMRSIRYWPSPPLGESDYRYVVFFDHGEPTWFSYGAPSDKSQRDENGFTVNCFESSHMRLVEEEGGFTGHTYRYWRVHWTGKILLK